MITPQRLPTWNSTLTYEGFFWPKNRPELRYPGSLNVEAGSPRLTVTAPPIGQEVFALGSATTLYGEVDTADGPTIITLWDKSGHHLHHQSNGTDHSRTFTHAFLGEHLDDESVAAFKFSAASFHDLGYWSTFRTLIVEGTPDAELPHHTVATIQDPYLDVFGRSFVVEILLEYPVRVESSEYFPAGAIVNHQPADTRVVFSVEPPAPAMFHELLHQDFQALLTFCYQSGAPVSGQWIGTSPDALRVFLQQDTFRDRISQHLGDFHMALLPDPVPFGELVEAWWTLLEDDFPAPQVLTTYLHQRRGLLEQSAASVLAATEHLHTHLGRTQERFPPEELAVKKRLLRQAFPGPENATFREFMYEKFRENRPTLNTRLRELLEIVTAERLKMLGIDHAEWERLFMRVRNKLAHTGAHVPRRGDPSTDIDLANAQTRAILTLLLMHRMNLPSSVIDRAAVTLSEYPHRSW